MENILENNKLIAEFMGLTFVNNIIKIKDNLRGTALEDAEYLQANGANLPFDSDWNWLMEVVEKIESLGHGVDIIQTTNKQFCGIGKWSVTKAKSFESTKIEAVYIACVKFIKYSLIVKTDLDNLKNK